MALRPREGGMGHGGLIGVQGEGGEAGVRDSSLLRCQGRTIVAFAMSA